MQCLYNISKKNLVMKMVFCMQINTKVFYQLILTLWVSKFPTRWCYHNWWAWLSILKVFKVASLQYLYNISKKVKNRVHFLQADKHQSLYKLILSFLMELARDVQSTQTTKSYCDAKHSDVLCGSSHVQCYFFELINIVDGRKYLQWYLSEVNNGMM